MSTSAMSGSSQSWVNIKVLARLVLTGMTIFATITLALYSQISSVILFIQASTNLGKIGKVSKRTLPFSVSD